MYLSKASVTFPMFRAVQRFPRLLYSACSTNPHSHDGPNEYSAELVKSQEFRNVICNIQRSQRDKLLLPCRWPLLGDILMSGDVAQQLLTILYHCCMHDLGLVKNCNIAPDSWLGFFSLGRVTSCSLSQSILTQLVTRCAPATTSADYHYRYLARTLHQSLFLLFAFTNLTPWLRPSSSTARVIYQPSRVFVPTCLETHRVSPRRSSPITVHYPGPNPIRKLNLFKIKMNIPMIDSNILISYFGYLTLIWNF